VTDRPTAAELAEAVREFLESEVLPVAADDRLRFRTLVAMNALGIVHRELAALPAEDDSEARSLAARIRAGDVPPGTVSRVKATVEAKLAIASPHYVDTYR
jgi:hypothetical protein